MNLEYTHPDTRNETEQSQVMRFGWSSYSVRPGETLGDAIERMNDWYQSGGEGPVPV